MARLEKQISSQDFKVISQGLGIANFTLPTSLDKIERLSPLLLNGKERELILLRQGLKFLGKPITSINESVNLTAGYGTSESNPLLGPFWEGHGLATQPISYGYKLTEPMVTKGISHACSGDDTTLPFVDVKVAFVQALFSASGIVPASAGLG